MSNGGFSINKPISSSLASVLTRSTDELNRNILPGGYIEQLEPSM